MRLGRAVTLSLLLVCLFTGIAPAQSCPPPDLTVSSPVCPGTQTSAVTYSGGAGTVTTWAVTHATLDYQYGDRIFFTPDGSGPVDVTVTFTDAAGCTASRTATADLVGPKPVITIDQSGCANGTISATASGNWPSYQWTITNGTLQSGQGTASITFTRTPGNQAETMVAVSGRSTYNGTFSCSVDADPVSVRRPPAPVIALGTPDICPYGTDTARVPAEYTNYWWSLTNGTIVAGDGTNAITFQRSGYPASVDDPVTISLWVPDSNGCPIQVPSVTVPTRKISAPVIALGTPDICPYGTDTARVPAEYTNYWWSVSNGTIISGDGTNAITFQRGGYPPGGSVDDPVTISLYVQDANGCPAQAASVTVPTRHIAAPVIALGTPDICPYGTDTARVPAEYTNYWWSVSNGTIISGDGTNAITFQRGGYPPGGSMDDPITISLYVQDANGCPVQATSVTVPTRKIAPPLIALGTPDICRFGTDTAQVPPEYAHYWWSITNGTIVSGDGTNSITFQRGGYSPTDDPITISLYVQDANGCPVQASSVTVPTRNIAPPQIALGTPDICQFGTDTAQVPAEYANYWWSVTNGTIVSGDHTNAITFQRYGSPTDPVTISLYVQDANGCPVQASSVTVPTRTIAAPQITLGAPSVCPGGTGSASVPAGYANYWWSITNGTILSDLNSNAITFRADGSAEPVLSVFVQDTNGCPVKSGPVTVPFSAAPAPKIYVGQQYSALAPSSYLLAQVSGGNTYSYCGTGVSVSLFATTGVAGDQYRWNTGGTGARLTVTQSGTYTVTATNADGCSADASITININPYPTASITASGPLDLCPNGGSVVLTANAADSYLWSTGETTRSITVAQPGAYHVTVTTNGCAATSADTYVTMRDPGTISGGRTFCPGGSVTLTAPAAASYSWNTGATTQSITVTQGGTYSVTITDAGGCSMTPPAATVVASTLSASASASVTSFCSGQSSTLTASAAGGTGQYTYQWSDGSGPIAGATGSSYVTTTGGSYSVAVTDAGGCTVRSAPVVLTANTTPTPYIYVPQSFCAGGTYTVQAQSTGSGVTYEWSIANATVLSASGNNVTIRVGDTGSVDLKVMATTSAGCSGGSGTFTVPIAAPPDVSFTLSGAVCGPGEHAQEVTPSQDVVSYDWSIAGGTITQNAGHRVYFVADAAATEVVLTVTATNTAGCSRSASLHREVHALPDATITASGPLSFCAGGSVTLSAPAGMTAYTWSTGATTQSISVSTPGSYRVSVVDAGGCSNTSADTVVTVNANPSPAVTASGPLSFCAGGSVTLSAPAGMTSYSWSNGAATQSITVSAGGSYHVTAVDANGCRGTSSDTVVTVNANPSPVVNASGPLTFCAGGSVVLTAPAGMSRYSWSNGAATQSITVSAGGSYHVTVVDANGCSGTSADSVVTVRALPAASVSGGATICAGGSANVSATLTGTAPFTVRWSDGFTQTVSGTTATRSVSPAATTTYTIASVTDANGCTSGAGSGSATVTVNAPASIATQPSNKTTTRNASVTLSVAAAGTSPISYQWFNGNGTAISGATSSSYTTSFTKKGTYTFYVEVWNACNATHVRSATVTITVN